jgi:diguanylate cyclase (GGDEF)-like protein/hemerythrin-like metal-binding protein
MPAPQADWLLEPHVRHFFADFPLALALLRQDGGIVAVNARFRAAFEASSLETGDVRSLVSSPGADWKSIGLVRKEGGESLVRARALSAEENVLLVVSDRVIEGPAVEATAEMQQRLSQLERLVATDRLTGIWNRAHLDRMIEIEIARSARYQLPLSLVLLDIDHFKRINDRFGHATGDVVLREVVHVVQQQVRGADMLFRWGGEEFVVMTPSTGYRSAERVAEKIRAAVETHDFPAAGRVTVSLGVAEHLPLESAEDWFKRVDKALYAAKEGGRNRAVVDRRGSSDLWAAGAAQVIRLQWSETYECGEPTIDSQHRRLFDLANRLIETAMDADRDRGPFNAALEELLAHVARHFADEEGILALRRYAHLEAHRRAHAGLLARAGKLKEKAAAGDVALGELVEFLAHDVVARHLLTADRDFFPLFA